MFWESGRDCLAGKCPSYCALNPKHAVKAKLVVKIRDQSIKRSRSMSSFLVTPCGRCTYG